MKPIDANAAAFPSFPIEGGLTKREYFAAMALQGLLASDLKEEHSVEAQAQNAVWAADALIEALEGE